MNSRAIALIVLLAVGVDEIYAEGQKYSFSIDSPTSGIEDFVDRDSMREFDFDLGSAKAEGFSLSFNDTTVNSKVWDRIDLMFLMGVYAGGAEIQLTPQGEFQGTFKWKQLLQVGILAGYGHLNTYNSMPVCLLYRGELTNRPGGLFYYAAYGINKVWLSDSDRNISDLKGRGVLKAGIGFIFENNSNVDFTTSIGWSRTKIWEETLYESWGGEYRVEKWSNINRMEIKIGICF